MPRPRPFTRRALTPSHRPCAPSPRPPPSARQSPRAPSCRTRATLARPLRAARCTPRTTPRPSPSPSRTPCRRTVCRPPPPSAMREAWRLPTGRPAAASTAPQAAVPLARETHRRPSRSARRHTRRRALIAASALSRASRPAPKRRCTIAPSTRASRGKMAVPTHRTRWIPSLRIPCSPYIPLGVISFDAHH